MSAVVLYLQSTSGPQQIAEHGDCAVGKFCPVARFVNPSQDPGLACSWRVALLLLFHPSSAEDNAPVMPVRFSQSPPGTSL